MTVTTTKKVLAHLTELERAAALAYAQAMQTANNFLKLSSELEKVKAMFIEGAEENGVV